MAFPLPLGKDQGEGIAARRYVRAVRDPPAEIFQSGEGGLFDGGLGDADATH